MSSIPVLSAALKPRAVIPPTEVEAKFTTHNPELLRELAAHAAPVPGYCFDDLLTKSVEDVYLDTPEYRLMRQGYQLRARNDGGEWRAALKSRGVASEVGIYHRLELEEELPGTNPPAKIENLPESIAAALAGLVEMRTELTTICVLEQTRQLRTVTSESPGRTHAAGLAMMRLYLDEIGIRSTVDQPILAHAYEVEVELAQGIDLAELQVLADRFMGTYGLIPSADSKLERALRIISRHPTNSPEDWQGIGLDLHMGEACRIIWYEQLMALLLNEAGVRYSTDPEYVHAARVAIRRARAAARLYKGYFQPKGIRRYLKMMRRTAQLLGAVRDLDVAIAKLLNYQKKSKKRAAGDIQHTLDGWMSRRADAHRELVAWFDTKEYGKFVREFLEFCRTPGAEILEAQPQTNIQVPPFQVRHVVPPMLLDNFAHVRCYEVCFDGDHAVQLPTLHQLRIECKYLRYNLEFVRDLLGEEGSEIINALKTLQDNLGDLNDAVVSKELLTDAGDGGSETEIARYESAQDKSIAKLRDQVHVEFARFVGPENRQRLLRTIARL